MHPMFKTVPLVDNDMDRRLRDPEPPRRRPDGGLVFDDVQRQALGPLLHVSLHSITLPTPCCQFGRARCGSCICAEGLHHNRRRDIIDSFAIYDYQKSNFEPPLQCPPALSVLYYSKDISHGRAVNGNFFVFFG